MVRYVTLRYFLTYLFTSLHLLHTITIGIVCFVFFCDFSCNSSCMCVSHITKDYFTYSIKYLCTYIGTFCSGNAFIHRITYRCVVRRGRVVRCWTCDREVAGSHLTHGCCVPTPTQRAIPPGSVNEIWGVNGHTTRCTSPVSVVSRLRLCQAGGYRKRRSTPPYGPQRLWKHHLFSPSENYRKQLKLHLFRLSYPGLVL